MPKRTDIETVRTFLDDLWKQAQSMLSKGRVTTSQVAHTAKVKMDIYLLNSKKEDLFLRLGEYFYLSGRRKKPSAKKQRNLVALLQEIKEIEAHEKDLRKALRAGLKESAKPGRRRGRPPKKAAAKKAAAKKAPVKKEKAAE